MHVVFFLRRLRWIELGLGSAPKDGKINGTYLSIFSTVLGLLVLYSLAAKFFARAVEFVHFDPLP
jgi:hypothetical protein